MNNDSIPVIVHILEKEYRVACPPNEREALLASASYLNKKMKEIRDSGKVVGADRIAVMAALNLAHDLLKLQTDTRDHAEALTNRVLTLQGKVDKSLNDCRQLEL